MNRILCVKSDERGVALVMALLMTLAVVILTSSMILVGRSEAISSLSYTAMSQVRYGAESGVHAATNYLLHTYVAPGTGGDPLSNYDMTVSPVTFNGRPVVLSSDPEVSSNYPVSNVRDAFTGASQGALDVNGAAVGFNARATLVSMRQITNAYTGLPVTLQRWEISGTGRIRGSGASLVEVSSILERQPVPLYSYATFATFNGCNAMSFDGGATTMSYDSGALVGGNPVVSLSDGNVGTNGNLDGNGDPTTINGTLSTPRAGVGNCTTNNVTAATIAGWATVEDGLVTLPQALEYPTPPDPNPLPPTTSTAFGSGGCPSTNPPPYCSPSAGGSTITPPSAATVVSMGNVSVGGNGILRVNAGIYEINSLTLTGNARIIVDSGPVIFRVAGQGQPTPIDLSGGGVSNPSLDPTQLQFLYGGTGEVKITGGTDTAALVYAPNASSALTGSSTNFFGSIITSKVTATGGFNIHYDRRLGVTMLTPGNPTMTAFTWRTF
jgi:hypothetical protein